MSSWMLVRFVYVEPRQEFSLLHFLNFVFVVCVFGVRSQSIIAKPMSRRFSPNFSSRSFIVSSFMFKYSSIRVNFFVVIFNFRASLVAYGGSQARVELEL